MARLGLCLIGFFLIALGQGQPPFSLPPVQKSEDVRPEVIDTLVRDTLKRWRVPGAALAIVHHDRLVYLKGHGVRELGKPDSVTPETVFPIASCTKPFTSLAIGMLVSDGAMAWDDPVRKHIPFFHLSDALADANVTIRDLLAHRTGVGRHELLWYKAPWDLEERIRKVAALELDDSFRARFHYQTILFGAAGYAAGKTAGANWEQLIQERVLGPLDMKSSSPVFRPGSLDMAMPHRHDKEGKLVAMSRYPLDKPDPAGSFHSTARDLSQFLRFELSGGVWNGRRLIGADALAERHKPQMVVPRDGFARAMNPATVQICYGLGWIIQDYHGRLLLQHGGAIDGFRSHLALVPEADLGIAILTNLDRGFMNLALSNTLIDNFLGLPGRDWSSYFLSVQARGEAEDKARVQRVRAARKLASKPTLALEAYVGRYYDSAYGTCEVVLADGQLTWLWGNWRCPLGHYEDDVFLTDADGMNGFAAFQVDKTGSVRSLKMLDRVFRRVPGISR